MNAVTPIDRLTAMAIVFFLLLLLLEVLKEFGALVELLIIDFAVPVT